MKKKIISLAAIGVLVSSLLTGCMQSEGVVSFKKDGSVEMSAAIRVEKEAIDSSDDSVKINGKDPKTFKVVTVDGIKYYQDKESKTYSSFNEAMHYLNDEGSGLSTYSAKINQFNPKTVDINLGSDGNKELQKTLAMFSLQGKGKVYMKYTFMFPDTIKNTNGVLEGKNTVSYEFTPTSGYDKIFATTLGNIKPTQSTITKKIGKLGKIKVKRNKTKISLRWGKAKNTRIYVIEYSKFKNNKKVGKTIIKKTKNNHITLKRLKKNTKYKITLYSKWGNYKVKQKTITVKTRKGK